MMGGTIGNQNAAYPPEEREFYKSEFIKYLEEGNCPSYFPPVKKETVEEWFVSDTEKQLLENAKRKYKEFWFKQLKSAATGINTNIVPSVLIFTTKNILKDEGFDDRQKSEHSGNLQVTRIELPAKAQIGDPVDL